MTILYIAVPEGYFLNNKWPAGIKHIADAMKHIWRVASNVRFIRSNHPFGDLYEVTMDIDDRHEAIAYFTLVNTVGVVVDDIDAIREPDYYL